MNITIESGEYEGWQVHELREGPLLLRLAPSIGGRILSLQYEGEELFFIQKEHAGETFRTGEEEPRALKKRLGFRLWGGDKTWVAPQSEWWEAIPPADLDAGSYEAVRVEGGLRMKSPLCRETGIRIEREVRILPGGAIRLEQTFTNESDQPISRGIWDVTQILRPFDVYLPASPEEIRGYETEGDSPRLHASLVRSAAEGWSSLPCREPLHFKFGVTSRKGSLLAMREGENHTLVHLRTFEVDPSASYAHDANIEVYNSPTYDYLELEVHAPLRTLSPGESATHIQKWYFGRVKKGTPPGDAMQSLSPSV